MIQSSQAFGFLYGMLACFVFVLVEWNVKGSILKLRASLTDILLGLYAVLVAYAYWKYHSEPLKILIFGAFALLFLAVRLLPNALLKYLLIGVVVSGIVQAAYGNLQLWGYYPSNHSIFRITGSFFNPGPYSGYLAGTFPVALAFYLYKETLLCRIHFLMHSGFIRRMKKYFHSTLLKGNKIIPRIINGMKNRFSLLVNYFGNFIKNRINSIEVICLASMVVIVLVLPASRSRAAWLAVIASSMYLLAYRYKGVLANWQSRYLNSFARKTGALVLITVLFGGILSALYHFKKDSADGRLLIWKVGLEMIKDKPVWGHGTDKFAASYMNYQADYFRSHPDSPEAMVADNVSYAYNEFLKLTIEYGLAGLLLVIAVLFTLFFGKTKKGEEQILDTKSPLGDLGVKTSPANRSVGINPVLLAVRAGLLAIIVFSLFSYPSDILPIKMLLVLFVAIIANQQKVIRFRKAKAAIRTKQNRGVAEKFIRYAMLLIILVLVYPAFKYIGLQYRAYQSWKDASDIYNIGAYPECLEDFELAYPQLKNNGSFLVQYGKALEMAEKPDSSIFLLNRSKEYLNNTISYTTLGNNYKTLGKTQEAEQAYLHAWHMIPSRFYPKYLLAKLYDESGQKDKAVSIAKELLNKEIKINSKAIEEIKKEMRKIIFKYASLQSSKELLGKEQKTTLCKQNFLSISF
nr:O-antigen ligase family protein [uncultured Draconibacterium sp.]